MLFSTVTLDGILSFIDSTHDSITTHLNHTTQSSSKMGASCQTMVGCTG